MTSHLIYSSEVNRLWILCPFCKTSEKSGGLKSRHRLEANWGLGLGALTRGSVFLQRTCPPVTRGATLWPFLQPLWEKQPTALSSLETHPLGAMALWAVAPATTRRAPHPCPTFIFFPRPHKTTKIKDDSEASHWTLQSQPKAMDGRVTELFLCSCWLRSVYLAPEFQVSLPWNLCSLRFMLWADRGFMAHSSPIPPQDSAPSPTYSCQAHPCRTQQSIK